MNKVFTFEQPCPLIFLHVATITLSNEMNAAWFLAHTRKPSFHLSLPLKQIPVSFMPCLKVLACADTVLLLLLNQ
jgi:hypothetical protein